MDHRKLVVSSALDTLVSGDGDIDEAYRIVIEFGSKLPEFRLGRVTTYTVAKKSRGPSFKFAQERYDASMKNDEKEICVAYEGDHIERIGSYEMTRSWDSIIFEEPKTEKNTPDKSDNGAFILIHDRETLKPLFFGKRNFDPKDRLFHKILRFIGVDFHRVEFVGLYQFSGAIASRSIMWCG